MATKGDSFRGIDYQQLEGGGGGGMSAGFRSGANKAIDTGIIASGLGLASVPFTQQYRLNQLDKERKEKREAAAEMKRETRGVEKTSSDRAREAAEEESTQRKTNKAAEEASKNMAKGGKVNSASARADGIAQRGKTRGRVL